MVDRSRLDTKIQTCAHRSCISVHGLFPFNPAALQVLEPVSRGTALCYRANLATKRPPAEPALPCLPTHPPIYLSTSAYRYTHNDADGSTSTNGLFRAFMPLYSASLGQVGIHRGRKHRRGDAMCLHSRLYSLHTYLFV